MADETANTPEAAVFSHVVTIANLARQRHDKINLRPGDADLLRIARALGLVDLRKLALIGELRPVGRRDWQLSAHLGATIVQSCVVSLAPVTTRIEEDVQRIWCADMVETSEAGSEEEMPEDTSQEPLGREIDLGRVLVEALGLALPIYPRAEGATLTQGQFAAPGLTPMQDQDALPFAGLAGLRDSLQDAPQETAQTDGGADGGDDQDGGNNQDNRGN